jgi:hypothetical protein
LKPQAKAEDRMRAALKQFQPILESAKTRDVNESDTVVIVTDLLQEVFGYDKYSEITSEHVVKSTNCDLAIKLDGAVVFLIEVKAVGYELKDTHVRQAVDYAANAGLDWVGLTNGRQWQVYKVSFTKPIEHELVVEFDLLSLELKKNCDLGVVGLIAKEAWPRAGLAEYSSRRQALSKFTLGALIMSDPVLDVIRRELRRTSEGLKVEADEIGAILGAEVIKREVLEGDKALVAAKRVAKAQNRSLRKVAKDEVDGKKAPRAVPSSSTVIG